MSETDGAGQTDGDDGDLLGGIGRRRRRGVLVTSAAVVALGLSLGGGAVAGATSTSAPPSTSTSSGPTGPPTGASPALRGSPPAAVGTVASVGDGTFTLTTADKTTVTVNVSASTTYQDQGVTSPTIANVTVGEHVAVFGTDTSDVVTATSVAIGEPPAGGRGGPPNRAAGGPGGGPPSGAPGRTATTSTTG
jgi:hypothetical protein